jgi:ubiquitin carboxyl-terminal hydrolase 25/28
MALRPRRPLPTPTSSPNPGSPVATIAPILPSTFYASNQNPPPLPTRSRNAGSGHTIYVAPPTPPPNYPTYREPELINEEPISTDESVPELIPQENEPWYNNSRWGDTATVPWDSSTQPNSWDSQEWSNNADTKWPNNFDTVDYWSSSYASKAIAIDGRDEEEEKFWWDPAVREKCNRPGSGILPPILADLLHNAEHSLFCVSVTPPDLRTSDNSIHRPTTPRGDVHDAQTPASASFPHTPHPPPPPPPTPDDVRMAVPHPNAYYCTKENGWVLLLWKSSSVFPPLAKSFRHSAHPPFPDQNRRKRTGSCIGEEEQPFGQMNRTHHFHVYKKAVDARNLNPPFHRSDWEKTAKLKHMRRTKTIHMEGFDSQKLKTLADERMEEDQIEEEEGDLLDLFVCCQCSFYCVASALIPGVISRRTLDDFIRDKRDHPAIGKSKEVAVYNAVETLIRYAKKMIHHLCY